MPMAKKPEGTIQSVCPCCNAKLVIDAALGVVISHEAPPKAGPGIDLNDAAGILARAAAAVGLGVLTP